MAAVGIPASSSVRRRWSNLTPNAALAVARAPLAGRRTPVRWLTVDHRHFELHEIDRIRIAETVRTLCAQRGARLAKQTHPAHQPTRDVNPDEAVGLAMALYDTAASFGISRELMDSVTGIPDAAIAALALRATSPR